MAKISALDLLTTADGTESVPVVKAGRARRMALAALAAAMTPFLTAWYKGDKGDAGGNVLSVASFQQLRASGRMVIGSGTSLVLSSHHTIMRRGAAFYQRNDALTDDNLASFPLTTFKAQDEAGVVTRWMLAETDRWEYEALGCKPFTGSNPGSADDCSPGYAEMHALNAFLRGRSVGEVPGRQIVFGNGRYYHSKPHNNHAKWEFIGQGGGTAGGPRNTDLVFAPDCYGVILNRHNTDVDQVGLTNSQGASDGTAYRRLGITSLGGSDPTRHGIWGRARGVLEDVTFTGFPGNNIHIVANSSADATLGTNLVAGNANDFQLNRVVCQGSGRHGVYISGIDANSIVSVGLSVLTAGCGGIIDINFLGNSHFGASIHTCGQLGLGSVSYAGRRYRLISTSPNIGATTVPGTANAIWYDIGAGGVNAEFKAWSNSGSYVPSGGLLCNNPNSRTVFTGGYPEYATIGKCHVTAPSMVQGGWLDTEFTTYSSFDFFAMGVGSFRAHNGGWGSYRPTAPYGAAAADNYGDYIYAAFGEEMLDNGGAFMRVGRQGAALWDLRGKYLGKGQGTSFDWGNDGNNHFMRWLGPAYSELHGRSTRFGATDTFPVMLSHGLLLRRDGRLIGQSFGSPATGRDRAAGDFIFNAGIGEPCAGYKVTRAAVVNGDGQVTTDATVLRTGALFIDAVTQTSISAIAPGACSPATTVIVPGAVVSDAVTVTAQNSTRGLQLIGWVDAENTVRFYAANPAGSLIGSVGIDSGNFYIRLEKMA